MTYLKRLKPHLFRYKKKLIIGLFVITISAVFTNMIPFVISKAIDAMQTGIETGKILNYVIMAVAFSIASGVYFYRIDLTDPLTSLRVGKTLKMILVK